MRLACIAAAVIALSATAHADKEKARDHFKKGMALYNIEHFPDSIHEFELGYTEEPDPVFLYNIAQAYRMSQQGAKALDYYKKYLHLKPDAVNRDAVEKLIKALEASAGPPTMPATTSSLRAGQGEHVAEPAPPPTGQNSANPNNGGPSNALPPNNQNGSSGSGEQHVDLTPHSTTSTSGENAGADVTKSAPAKSNKWLWVGVGVGAAVVVAVAIVVGVVLAGGSPNEMSLPTGSIR